MNNLGMLAARRGDQRAAAAQFRDALSDLRAATRSTRRISPTR